MEDFEGVIVLLEEYRNGGRISQMIGLNSNRSDYLDILALAHCFASTGHDVRILQAVHYKDPVYRIVFGELYGSNYYRKCPDLWVDGVFIEYESYRTESPKNAFRNMLHNGLAQSDRVILRQCSLTDGYMIRSIRGLISAGMIVSEVYLFDGERIRLLYKTEG